MILRQRAYALCLLAATGSTSCVSRPEGSYKPRERVTGGSTADFSDEAGVLDGDSGSSTDIPVTEGLIGDDNVGSVPGAMRPLLRLTGRYALRREMHSIVKVERSFARLEVKNTTIHLSVAELALDPETGTLNMTERLCYQQYEHECVAGCTTWQTSVDARVRRFFPVVRRVLGVRGDRFQSDITVEGLGYSGDPEALPTQKDDARVWNVTGDESVREGVLTQIRAQGTPLGAVNCLVFTVQKFASSFAGSLMRGTLDGVAAPLDTGGSDARRLGATGASASTCEDDSGAAAPGSVPSSLTFSRIDMQRFSDEEFWTCPAETELAP